MIAWIDDSQDYGEERWAGIAPLGRGSLHTVIFAEVGEETSRVISLRRSTNQEAAPMQRKQATSKRRFRLNTPAEEARIQAGIKADPDNPELTPEQLSRMRPFRELQAERRRGRPGSAVHKKPVTVRLDAEIVQFFQASGPGWQTRMNAALVEYVKRHRLRPRLRP